MICLACGEELPHGLELSGSVRCFECREGDAPVSADLLREAPAAKEGEDAPSVPGEHVPPVAA